MDSSKLIEIRNNLSKLPQLELRLHKMQFKIQEAEDNVRSLLQQYEREAMDVERMEKESLSTMLLRFIGRYDGKLGKEIQEMVNAKIAYDKGSERVKELYFERNELSERISSLRHDRVSYQSELSRREQDIMHNVNDERFIQYQQLESEEDSIIKQLVETEEAIHAANKAGETARRVLKHLDSAETWATVDVWMKGGILTHMAKYTHIDNAEADYNILCSNMKDLQKELEDVNLSGITGMLGIDSTTRAVDFWLDNIFTDLNVRSRIRNDKEQLGKLLGIIHNITDNLESSKANIERQIELIEYKKNELIILS